jgi:hypothetical protein
LQCMGCTARSIFGGDCASHTDFNRESESGLRQLRKLRLGRLDFGSAIKVSPVGKRADVR